MGEGLLLKWGKVLRTYNVNGKAMGEKGGGTFCLFACASVRYRCSLCGLCCSPVLMIKCHHSLLH